ncbi:hypothetical protein LB467_16840 [Salegentibacter sp. JZCK2]|uniref:hypothetical protein n=1 Tax=Salegentibacter tibetensis TaxID=2873600 RepID=UPI001CCC2EEC|nr:hypothetical protein [Salegentibacter tibetensis]MBZ9731358.1 hypothetical protein [Salegentibacter tibetensis]
MNFKNLFFAAILIFSFSACRETANDDHGHRHDEDGGHINEEHSEQEEFKLGEDSLDHHQESDEHTHEDGTEHHDH